MGDPCHPLEFLWARSGGHPPACRPFAWADDRRDPGRSRRRRDTRHASPGSDRTSCYRLHDRTKHSSRNDRRNPARVAPVRDGRRRGDRSEWGTWVAAHALAGAPWHRRSLGLIARSGYGDDADGCRIWRRHPACRLDAVSPRPVGRLCRNHPGQVPDDGQRCSIDKLVSSDPMGCPSPRRWL
jgi:hypothetical protein